MELLYSGWGDKFGRNPTFYKLDIEFFMFFYSAGSAQHGQEHA